MRWTCPDLEQLASLLYPAGRSPEPAPELQSHLNGCERCRALLQHLEQFNGTADLLRAAGPPTPRQAAPRHPTPHELGGYPIIRELGRGGMGVVYEAYQPTLRRSVALKVIPARVVLDEHREEWFRREAEALARLHHPHIAAVYDAGYTAKGEPFLVMELVRGVALGTFLRDTNPPQRRRIELFTVICRAVGYAHECGVIHRDIKPSNILVDDHGSPKVIDFGVARILNAPNGDTRSDVSYRVPRTVSYASPERLHDEACQADPRSDVYSLGLVLLEMLTGRRPEPGPRSPLAGTAPREDARRQRRPAELDRALRGDLEPIILRAIDTDPGKRYPNAHAIADDLERLLARRPVSARPQTRAYNLRCFVRRHKTAVALTAIAFALTWSFAVWMTALYARADRAEKLAQNRLVAATRAHDEAGRQAQRAEDEARKAWDVADMLDRLVTTLEPVRTYIRDDAPLSERLRNAAESVETRFDADPDMRRFALTVLGRSMASLDLFDDGESHLRTALDISRRHYGPEHEITLGVVEELGHLLCASGRHPEAVPLFEDSLEARRKADAESPALAKTLWHLAYALRRSGALAEAEDRLQEFIALQRRLYLAGHPATARALHSLSGIYRWRGAFEQAGFYRREAVRELANAPQEAAQVRIDIQLEDAWVARANGQLPEAVRLAEAALSQARRRLGESHPTAIYGLVTLSAFHLDAGHLDRAESYAVEAVEFSRSPVGGVSALFVDALSRWAGILWAKGDYAAAEAVIRQAAEMSQRLCGEDCPRSVRAQHSLGVILRDQGRFAQAEPILSKVLADERRVHPEEPYGAANGLANLARLYYLTGDHPRAETHMREALTVRRGLLPDQHPDIAESTMVLGMVLTATQRSEEAEPLLRQALAIRRSYFGEKHWLTGETLSALAECRMNQGAHTDVRTLLENAVEALCGPLLPGHKAVRLTRARLARLCRNPTGAVDETWCETMHDRLAACGSNLSR